MRDLENVPQQAVDRGGADRRGSGRARQRDETAARVSGLDAGAPIAIPGTLRPAKRLIPAQLPAASVAGSCSIPLTPAPPRPTLSFRHRQQRRMRDGEDPDDHRRFH